MVGRKSCLYIAALTKTELLWVKYARLTKTLAAAEGDSSYG